MTGMVDAIRRPNAWIFASVVYIWLLGLSKLFAAFGPPYVIPRIAHMRNSFWLSDLGKAFLFYAREAANALGYEYGYVLYPFAGRSGKRFS